MLITLSDVIGIVSVSVDENGVSFCDGKAYFTDTDGDDWTIDANQIHVIA